MTTEILNYKACIESAICIQAGYSEEEVAEIFNENFSNILDISHLSNLDSNFKVEYFETEIDEDSRLDTWKLYITIQSPFEVEHDNIPSFHEMLSPFYEKSDTQEDLSGKTALDKAAEVKLKLINQELKDKIIKTAQNAPNDIRKFTLINLEVPQNFEELSRSI